MTSTMRPNLKVLQESGSIASIGQGHWEKVIFDVCDYRLEFKEGNSPLADQPQDFIKYFENRNLSLKRNQRKVEFQSLRLSAKASRYRLTQGSGFNSHLVCISLVLDGRAGKTICFYFPLRAWRYAPAGRW